MERNPAEGGEVNLREQSRVVSFAPTDSLERLISTDPPGGIGGSGLDRLQGKSLGACPRSVPKTEPGNASRRSSRGSGGRRRRSPEVGGDGLDEEVR